MLPHTLLSCRAQAGIQYAAAARVTASVSGILDRPLSRTM